MDSVAGTEPDAFASYLQQISRLFQAIPGSNIFLRYVRSSYQNDPFRTLLELVLFGFALRTILQNRSRSARSNFVELSRKDTDYIVKEFEPEPLSVPLTPAELDDLHGVAQIVGKSTAHVRVAAPWLSGTQPRTVLNLASFNFTGLLDAPEMTQQALHILREYGVGSCSPPGFYGTSDMLMHLEQRVAKFARKPAAIVYSQGYSTISGVIPAFCKRGDIVVADSALNFAAQKGIQLSRSDVHWFDHNDMDSLETVLHCVVQEQNARKGPLRRRFIITEGNFETDGTVPDLARIVALKKRYKFRFLLDESYSIGVLGATGRGTTELCGVDPADIDFVVGNFATSFGAGGGFAAASVEAVKHQRINGLSFVFSAAMPVMLTNGSTVAMNKIDAGLDVFARLAENVRIFRSVLDKVQTIYIPSHPASPTIHIQVKPKYAAPDAREPEHDLSAEEQTSLLRVIARDATQNGVFLCPTRRLRSINVEVNDRGVFARPSLRLCITASHTPQEATHAADIVRASIARGLAQRS
ncbi:serine C-palmitoyltransferase [Malassezia sp. CBS 17886]|nr:serine C-palmitoyltransferase [Malassezia sp. CBS 17886]